MTPTQYIQRKRTKGFNLQAQSPDGRQVVSCTRPSKWGNPHKAIKNENGYWKRNTRLIPALVHFDRIIPSMFCVGEYANDMQDKQEQIQEALEGKHLACYCKVGTPCHVQTILLPVVNGLRYIVSNNGELHWSDGVITGPNQFYQRPSCHVHDVLLPIINQPKP